MAGSPGNTPGYLIECLAYSVPDSKFGHPTLYLDMRSVLDYLWDATNNQEEAEKPVEVNEPLWLFRGRPDRIPKNAHAFIDTARRYINE